MSQKQYYTKYLNTKSVCKNLKEQELVWLCKENIYEKKEEKVLKKYTGKKGIVNFLRYKIFKIIENFATFD